MSHHALKSVQPFFVGDNKNKMKGEGRKCTKTYEIVIFHAFVEKTPVNRF